MRMFFAAVVLLSSAEAFGPQATAQQIAGGKLVVFEAASIKERTPPDSGSSVGRRPGGRFEARNASLRELIEFAYEIQTFQLVGIPAALEAARWDISAKLEGLPRPAAPDDTLRALHALLADRFALVVRQERRELPAYAMTTSQANGTPGKGLVRSALDCPALVAAARSAGGPPPADALRCGLRGRVGSIQGIGVPLSELAQSLSTRVQRTIVDKTGLTGTWDFTVTYAADASVVSPGTLPRAPPCRPLAPTRRRSSRRCKNSSD